MIRDVSTASGSTPVRLKAERLELAAVELGDAEREIDAADERRQLLAGERRQPEQRRIVRREERRRRDVVVDAGCGPSAARERLGHRRRQRVVKDRDVAASGGGVAERPDVAEEVVVDRQRVELRLVAQSPQQIAQPPRAVADRVAPVRGRNPLVDDHGASGSAL